MEPPAAARAYVKVPRAAQTPKSAHAKPIRETFFPKVFSCHAPSTRKPAVSARIGQFCDG
jgi:hypothetical protein